MRPGATAWPHTVYIERPDTRKMDGDTPINFDDHIAEQHAVAVIDLLRPLLVGGWKIKPTGQWGKYVLEALDWTDHFDLVFTFNIDEMKVVVRTNKFGGAMQPRGVFDTIPIEHPQVIEFLAAFVFEQLRDYDDRKILTDEYPSATSR